MINYNSALVAKSSSVFSVDNRGFKYGDSLFETIKIIDKKARFLEDHYFRLMASMRMLRMEIPMYFTLDFFEKEIVKTLDANNLTSARVRFSVFRNDGGYYCPKTNTVGFVVETSELKPTFKENFTADLFTDFYNYSGILSTLKTNNRIVNVLAANFAFENQLDTCFLLNEKKMLVEAVSGNLFLVQNNQIKTPNIASGCIKGIIRKKIIELVSNNPNFDLIETEISPFDLLKADEVFITNAIIDIQPITNYRKKEYDFKVAEILKNELQNLI
jgi:branched-chain amino acid aminotransferase